MKFHEPEPTRKEHVLTIIRGLDKVIHSFIDTKMDEAARRLVGEYATKMMLLTEEYLRLP